MRKVIITLAVLVMAYGNVGFAQRNTPLKSNATANVLKHYGVRNETTVVPQTATWHTVDGEKYRTTYTYDEYDYYLIEEFFEINEGDGWRDFYLITYEYDFAGNVIEAMGMSAYEMGVLENDAFVSYTYEGGELSEVIYQYWENNEWVNETKEVYNYNGDVTTVLYWDWNGNNWASDELWTYTYSNESIELIIQYMEGGAWQNDERVIYTLDFDENVTEITYSDWTGTTWVNDERKVYNYADGVYVSMMEEDWLNGSWEPHYKCDYVYVDGNATHGECFNVTGGNSLPADYDMEMAYGYNAATKTFYGCEVDITYIDLTAVSENTTASFKVYPVPAENEIQIQADGFQKAEIYSLTGQKLMESTMEKMIVSALSQGVYVLKVYDQSGKAEAQRIVVK